MKICLKVSLCIAGVLSASWAFAEGGDEREWNESLQEMATENRQLTTQEDEEAVQLMADPGRSPAATKKRGSAKKKKSARRRVESGADREEGWILKKTKDGYIKVPRKQIFRFEGNVSAGAYRPSQTVLGQRPQYRETTLIPERSSFRQEFLEDAGSVSVGGK